jgi:hypothetical protein
MDPRIKNSPTIISSPNWRIAELRNELLAWRVVTFNSLAMPTLGDGLRGRLRERKPLLQIANQHL